MVENQDVELGQDKARDAQQDQHEEPPALRLTHTLDRCGQ